MTSHVAAINERPKINQCIETWLLTEPWIQWTGGWSAPTPKLVRTGFAAKPHLRVNHTAEGTTPYKPGSRDAK